MVYLLDANVLLTAQNLYCPVDEVPEFWDWLVHMGNAGEIKMPIETLEEVKDGSNDAERDLLVAWIQDDAHKAAILFDEDVQPALVQRVAAASGLRGGGQAPQRPEAPVITMRRLRGSST